MKTLDVKIGKKLVSDFRDVQFMTAEEKAGVARDFELFVIARLQLVNSLQLEQADSGSIFPPFTQRLYHHYMQHLGHIAHTNRWGFFVEEFENTRDFVENLKRAADGISLLGHRILLDNYGDLNQVMQAVALHYLPAAEALLAKEQQARGGSCQGPRCKDILQAA